MNSYNKFLIKSKLLAKLPIIYNNIKDNNYYYIQNLKDFLNYYLDNNSCNISNNNLLSNLITNMNLWNFNDNNIKYIIYRDFSEVIYNYDSTDDEMYELLFRLDTIII